MQTAAGAAEPALLEVVRIKKVNFRQQLKAAELMEKTLIEALKDKEQFRRYVVTEKREGGTQTEEYIFGKYDFKAMGEMVKVAKSLEELKRASAVTEENQETPGAVLLPSILPGEDNGAEE